MEGLSDKITTTRMRSTESEDLSTLRNTAHIKEGLSDKITTTRMRSTESEDLSSSARVNVKAKREIIISVAQQLAWLTAVFRKPHYGQTSYSKVVLNELNKSAENASKEFEIYALGLRKVHRSVKTCWLDLFSNCVIAMGFPIPKRSNGEKGIELPYGIMTSQAGTLFSKTYKGGLFLRGLSTLIYPTASWEDHQSVQWHIFDSVTSRERLPPGTIPLLTSPDEFRSSNWVRCTDLEKLALAPRTFLGYCKDINIYLATENSEISRVTYSQAENESHRSALLLDSLAGGTSGIGMVSAQASMRFVRPKGLVRCSMHDTLPGLLDSAQLRPVLVYDDHPEAQKGWLVPTLSVILHMAHVWAQGKYLLNKIPYVSPCWNAEGMAMRLIQEHGGLPLRFKREEMAMPQFQEDWTLRLQWEPEIKYECLRDVVQKLLISLEELIVDEALAEKDPDPTVSFESSKVYGWDLVDIAKLSLKCRRKQLSIHESWTVLSNEVLTLFCQGLGEVIRPASASNICSTWNPIPSQRHYLTATVPCLRQLSLQYGRASTFQCLRLSKDGYWHWPSDGLFDDCDCDANSLSTSNTHKCVKVPQQISRTDVASKSGQYLPTQGAVVFGTRQLQRIAPANWLSAHRTTNLEDSSNGHEHPGSSHETSNQNKGRSSFRAIKSALLKKLL